MFDALALDQRPDPPHKYFNSAELALMQRALDAVAPEFVLTPERAAVRRAIGRRIIAAYSAGMQDEAELRDVAKSYGRRLSWVAAA